MCRPLSLVPLNASLLDGSQDRAAVQADCLCGLGKLATGAACASYGLMPAGVGSQCPLHVNQGPRLAHQSEPLASVSSLRILSRSPICAASSPSIWSLQQRCTLAVSLWLPAGSGRPRRTAPCGAIALLLHRTTPPVDLPCVRARTAALVKMSLLFQRDFGPDNPAPRLSKFRQAPARVV